MGIWAQRPSSILSQDVEWQQLEADKYVNGYTDFIFFYGMI